MAELIRRRWEPTYAGMSRRDRGGCDFVAYVPDLLAGWVPVLPADLVADLSDAEAAVRALGSDSGGGRGRSGVVSVEGIARFLLRAESVASSKIEGLDVGPRRLMDAELLAARGAPVLDRVAVEVLGNVAAMEQATQLAMSGAQLRVDDVLGVHRVLMERSPLPELGGVVRVTQNWIGGSDVNPCSARFVPPPPEHVAVLLEDLVAYMNGDEHPPLVQAAIAHAQFETIHPFADGNGRTGRALIQIVLRRRGLVTRTVAPISLVLATWANRYVDGLMAFRHHGAADGPERDAGVTAWLSTFAAATLRACEDAAGYVADIEALQREWRLQLGAVRAGSAAALLVDVLPGAPVLTVESAAQMIGRSVMRTGEAVNRLVDAGVLRQRDVGRERYRVFEASGVLSMFTGLERALASPTGNTRQQEPIRAVPRRPTP